MRSRYARAAAATSFLSNILNLRIILQTVPVIGAQSRSIQTTKPRHPTAFISQTGTRTRPITRRTSILDSENDINYHCLPSQYENLIRNRHSSRLFASLSPASHRETRMLHFDTLDSTQNEVKKILHDASSHEPNTYLAVTTTSQTSGRGTKNRTWIGKKGNTFLTLAIPTADLKILPTLLPLQIGVILAETVQNMLSSKNTLDATVTLKWPNDVLVNRKKIAGVLIESERDHAGNYYFLIGIGVNYRHAPKVDSKGAHRGREATCICEYLPQDKIKQDDGVEEAKELGCKIASAVRQWIELQMNWDGAEENTLTRWNDFAEFGGWLILRDEPGDEIVTPLSLEKDGRLRVRGKDGKERLLCFDYLL